LVLPSLEVKIILVGFKVNGLKAVLLIILISGLLITGCSAGTNQKPVIGKPAPDFQLKNLDGQSISLSDFRGKPVLINFWASWCQPCVYEMPFIQEVFEEWSGQGLVVLTINIGESPSQVEEFMQSQGLSLPVLLDLKGSIAQKYNIWFIPTTFFLDKDGIIQGIKAGPFQSKEEIEAGIGRVIP